MSKHEPNPITIILPNKLCALSQSKNRVRKCYTDAELSCAHKAT
jgi:hypothetical protein